MTSDPALTRRGFFWGLLAPVVAANLEAEAADGTPARTDRFQVGLNVSSQDYWMPSRYFVNMMLDTSDAWRDAISGRTWENTFHGWPRAVKNTDSISRFIRWMDVIHPRGEPGNTYLKATDYRITTTGGWRIELVDQIGITNHLPGTNLCTFTVPDSDAPVRIRVKLSHASRTPKDLVPGELRCYEAAHESLLAADGFAFHPDAIALFRGVPVIRFANVNTVNGGYNYRDINDVVPGVAFMGGPWPPELIGKFARELGAGVWLNLPTWVDRTTFSCAAATNRISMVSWPQLGAAVQPPPANGERVMFWGWDARARKPSGSMDHGPYVVINRTATDFQLAHPSSPATPVDFTNDLPAAGNNLNLTVLRDHQANWTAYVRRLRDAYPACRLVVGEAFLEVWNGGYNGQHISRYLGNHFRTGSRTGGAVAEGNAYFTFLAWKCIEAVFGTDVHRRVHATSISAGVGSPALDVRDVNGLISQDTPMARLVSGIAMAPYFKPWKDPVPASVDWWDPQLNVMRELGRRNITETGDLGRDDIIADWTRNGAFSDQRWAQLCRNYFHYQHLHCRLWRDRMASHGRTIGVHYDMLAYEFGNHQRMDRPGACTPGDLDQVIQDSFIKWFFGSGGDAFRAEYKAALDYDRFTLCMYYQADNAWLRCSRQVNQWGLVPWPGAEHRHPGLRHAYDWAKRYF